MAAPIPINSLVKTDVQLKGRVINNIQSRNVFVVQTDEGVPQVPRYSDIPEAATSHCEINSDCVNFFIIHYLYEVCRMQRIEIKFPDQTATLFKNRSSEGRVWISRP